MGFCKILATSAKLYIQLIGYVSCRFKDRQTEQEWPSSTKSVNVSTFSSEDTNSRRSERAFK
jgi:hypothetical protein